MGYNARLLIILITEILPVTRGQADGHTLFIALR